MMMISDDDDHHDNDNHLLTILLTILFIHIKNMNFIFLSISIHHHYHYHSLQKVREALFSTLVFVGAFEGNSTRFLDVFSGSGSIGLEALSRGET